MEKRGRSRKKEGEGRFYTQSGGRVNLWRLEGQVVKMRSIFEMNGELMKPIRTQIHPTCNKQKTGGFILLPYVVPSYGTGHTNVPD